MDQPLEVPKNFFAFIGDLSYFGLRALGALFTPSFDWMYFIKQLQEIGAQSVPLITAAGLALGVVMTLHTHGTLTRFGAVSYSPTLQADSFLNQLGPMITALLVCGRVGAGIGAELANMRATEQIDAIEAMSIDSFNMLVVTRIAACIAALPMLTVFMDFAAMLGGFFSEKAISNISLLLYTNSALKTVSWVNFIPPTLKTSVFGFLIGTVSCYFGFTINEGANGVRRASTNSVVLSSLLVILVDVLLVKIIFFFAPENAL